MSGSHDLDQNIVKSQSIISITKAFMCSGGEAHATGGPRQALAIFYPVSGRLGTLTHLSHTFLSWADEVLCHIFFGSGRRKELKDDESVSETFGDHGTSR